MNKREQYFTEIIKRLIKEGWDNGREKSLVDIARETNFLLRQSGFSTPINPKLVGVYVRKFLNLDIERRGHDNKSFPVLTPEEIKKLND